MSRRFVLTPEAKTDLGDILLDIAEDSPEAADRVRSELYEGLRKLGRFPGLGHCHDELLSREYRFWNFYSFVVVDAWRVKPIRVISIVHGARDLEVFLSVRVGRDE